MWKIEIKWFPCFRAISRLWLVETDGITVWSAGVADGTISAEKLIKIIISWKNKSIGNDFVDSTLPWGGAVLIWIEETTDAMIEPTGSAVCSRTSADVSSGCGASCGWGGDGACYIWTSGYEGDDSTWIGDPGGGGGGAVVFWRFSCDLVFLGPFLFTLLDSGASTLALVLLFFTDLPVCWCNNESFISTNVTEHWWNFGWVNESYRWSSHGSRCILKRLCKYWMESV